jgi:hypothetical protein
MSNAPVDRRSKRNAMLRTSVRSIALNAARGSCTVLSTIFGTGRYGGPMGLPGG